MLRIFGVLLIVLTSSGTGFLLASNLNKRVENIELILSMIERIKTNICYSKTPTPQIIINLASYNLYKPLTFLSECQNMMREKTDFPTAWKKSVDKSSLHLQKDDITYLKSIGEILGSSDAESQINALDLTAGFLEQNLNDAKTIKNTNGKMYKALGTLFGIGIGILLL